MARSMFSSVNANQGKPPKTYVDSLSSCKDLRERQRHKEAQAMCSRILSHSSCPKGSSSTLQVDVLLERARCYSAASSWARMLTDCRSGLSSLCMHVGKADNSGEDFVPKVREEEHVSPQEVEWMQTSSLTLVLLEVQGTWKLRLTKEFAIAIKRSIAIAGQVKPAVLSRVGVFKMWPRIFKEAVVANHPGVWSSVKYVLDFLLANPDRVTELASAHEGIDFLFFLAAQPDSIVRASALRGLMLGLRNCKVPCVTTSFSPVLQKSFPCDLNEELFLHLRLLLEVADRPSLRKCVTLNADASLALLNMLSKGDGVLPLVAALLLQKWSHEDVHGLTKLYGLSRIALCDSIMQLSQRVCESSDQRKDHNGKRDTVQRALQLAFVHTHPLLSEHCKDCVEPGSGLNYLQHFRDQPTFLGRTLEILASSAKLACDDTVDWVAAIGEPLLAGLPWIESSCSLSRSRYLLLAWLHDLASVANFQLVDDGEFVGKAFIDFVELELMSSRGLECLQRLLMYEPFRREARNKPRLAEYVFHSCDALCRDNGYDIDLLDVVGKRKPPSLSTLVFAQCTCACRVMLVLLEDEFAAQAWANRLLVLRGPKRVLRWISIGIVDHDVAYTLLQRLAECGGAPLVQELWQLCSMTLENLDSLRSSLNPETLKNGQRNLILTILRESADGALLQAWAEKVNAKDVLDVVQKSMRHDAKDIAAYESLKKLSKSVSKATISKSPCWVHPARFRPALKRQKFAGVALQSYQPSSRCNKGLSQQNRPLDHFVPADDLGVPLMIFEAEVDALDVDPHHHHWRLSDEVMHGKHQPDFLVYTPVTKS